MAFEVHYQKAPEARKMRLKQLDTFFAQEFPRAQPSMKYNMPTIESETGWIAFANKKDYISVYTCAEDKIQPYLDKHPGTPHGKGCLRFRDNREIDFDALKEVASLALDGDG
jgi:uncharacterized protein YdhG (YjbR/CyaY superfamily)